MQAYSVFETKCSPPFISLNVLKTLTSDIER